MPGKTSLEQLLECGIQASWTELTATAGTALMRVEYHPGGDVPLEFVKIWASTVRGYWSLVCEYWPRSLSSRPAGLTFSNQYHSAGLAQAFAAITRSPAEFPRSASDGFDGFVLVENVTAAQQTEAEQQLAAAVDDAQAVPLATRAHRWSNAT